MTIESLLRRDRDWNDNAVSESVRFAVVGLGGFAREFVLPAIDRANSCTTTVLASGSPEKADRVAEAFDVDRTLSYEQFHDGVGADCYDVAYVATPNARHLEFVETAARLEKHVLCEKPMEVTSERASAMVEQCKRADVHLTIAYRMQTDPAVRTIRTLVREGVIGEPVQVHGHFSFRLLDRNDDPVQWRIDPELAGGGALVDIGIYPLNTARFVLDADPVTVRGATRSPDEAFDGVDEHVGFQLSFPDGVTASCTSSFDAYHDNWLRIVGTDGRIHLEPAFDGGIDRTVVVDRADERVEITPRSTNEIAELFEYVANAVHADPDDRPDGRHGLVDVRTMDAIYESAETGDDVVIE